jgi:hypothetical protein
MINTVSFLVSAESQLEREYRKKYEGIPIESMPDRITATYDNKHVFVTGGTGFMGKVLVEKLLRTCPKIGRIYLLMRIKKGKDPKDRIHDIFSSSVSVIKNINNFFNKILGKLMVKFSFEAFRSA